MAAKATFSTYINIYIYSNYIYKYIKKKRTQEPELFDEHVNTQDARMASLNPLL
jgi:hypothetical protein